MLYVKIHGAATNVVVKRVILEARKRASRANVISLSVLVIENAFRQNQSSASVPEDLFKKTKSAKTLMSAWILFIVTSTQIATTRLVHTNVPARKDFIPTEQFVLLVNATRIAVRKMKFAVPSLDFAYAKTDFIETIQLIA